MLFVRAVMGAMAQQEPLTFPGTGRHGTRTLGRGSIVLLGSTNSLVAAPGMLSYTTSKHAVMGLAKSAGKPPLVHEAFLHKLTTDMLIGVDALAVQSSLGVNAVCPCWVDTPMVQNAVKTNPMLGEAIKTFSPLKRAAAPDEVADYIVFLSSPSASFINGTALPIDAGLTLPAPPPLPALSYRGLAITTKVDRLVTMGYTGHYKILRIATKFV